MKRIGIIFAFISILLAGCQKESNVCLKSIEVPTNHWVSLSSLKDFPEMLDTLKVRKNIRINKVDVSTMPIGGTTLKSIVVRTNVLYQGLCVFTSQMNFIKTIKDENEAFITSVGSVPENITVSLTPLVSLNKAVKIAKENQKFIGKCYSHQLAIYDVNASKNQNPEYHLTWIIQGSSKNRLYSGSPIVVVDALTSKVLYSFDGKFE